MKKYFALFLLFFSFLSFSQEEGNTIIIFINGVKDHTELYKTYPDHPSYKEIKKTIEKNNLQSKVSLVGAELSDYGNTENILHNFDYKKLIPSETKNVIIYLNAHGDYLGNLSSKSEGGETLGKMHTAMENITNNLKGQGLSNLLCSSWSMSCQLLFGAFRKSCRKCFYLLRTKA